MKKTKMVLMAVMVLGVVLGVQSAGWASISFYVVDGEDAGNSVSVSLSTFSLTNFLPSSLSIYYGTGNTSPANYSLYAPGSQITINTNQSGYELLTLMIVGPSVPTYPNDPAGTIYLPGIMNLKNNFETYSSIITDWADLPEITWGTASDADGFAANVPIPASVLLLGAGLMGLVSFRKRSAHQ